MIEGCIFDIDGILIDSDKYNYLSLKKALNKVDSSLLKKKLDDIDPSIAFQKLMEIAENNLSKKDMENTLDLKAKYYSNYMSELSSSELKPGLKRFLINLRMYNIKIALSSNNLETETILDNLKVSNFFDLIFNKNDNLTSTEYTEMLTKTAEVLELNPKNCAVFQNCVQSIDTIKNIDMYAIGVGCPETLKNANKVIPNFHSVNASILR